MSELREVVTIYDHNSRDIPAQLRHLAKQIEDGAFGEVDEAVCCILGDTMEVFGWKSPSRASCCREPPTASTESTPSEIAIPRSSSKPSRAR